MGTTTPRALYLVLGVFLAACATSITEPVAVITKTGQVLRGTATASLSGGEFHASDGKLTCGLTYDALKQTPTLSAKVTCNDGRTGFAIINREAGGRAASGRIRMDDGSEADFIFGDAARAF